MRHLKKKKLRLRKTHGPKKALMRNLATSLVLYESIKTTAPKARALRPVIEKYITASKINNLATRRNLLKFFNTKSAVEKLLEKIGPRYVDRKGGYTRTVKIGSRQGDGAEVVQISLV